MRHGVNFGLAAILLACWSGSSSAQIVWQTPTQVSGPSDINSAGSSVDAYQALPSGNFSSLPKPTLTIGDTTFNQDTGNLTDGVISLSGPLGGGSDGGQSDTQNANYNSVIGGCVYVDDIPSDNPSGVLDAGVITLDVTAGNEYEVQLWNAYGVNFRNTVFTDGTSVEVQGGFDVIGTFLATGPTETIDFNGLYDPLVNNSGIGEVNAIALREVPEPSVWALLLGGVAVTAFALRRKIVFLN